MGIDRQQHDGAIFDAIGEPATHDDGSNTTSCVAVLFEEVKRWGDGRSQSLIQQDEIGLQHSEVSAKAGDTITFDASGDTYELVERVSDDGSVIRFRVDQK